jgi:hypothetical protein
MKVERRGRFSLFGFEDQMRTVFITSAITAVLLVACGHPAPDTTPTLAQETVQIPVSTSEPTSTPTIAPTSLPKVSFNPSSTPMPSDLIFADGFEGNSFSGWWSAHGKAPGLSVSRAAALIGPYGMQVVISGTETLYVQQTLPKHESRYRARFYFDPNSLRMGERHRLTIFKGFSGDTSVLRVDLRFKWGTYWLRARTLDNGAQWHSSGWFTITNAAHLVEFDWQAATAGGRNGSLTFWLDTKQMDQRTRIHNDTRHIDMVRLGAVGDLDATMSGTVYLDAFESHRETYIGP